ncbi:MAG: response regulator transcription factor [Flavobacteriales bacterium]|nr:response regulator transcription factor [Flavobacteriales bacterium]
MEHKYKAIVVDDEELGRSRLKKLLLSHSDQIDIIGEAADGEEGLALAEALKPEIIFLDIQMPVMDGFEMLQQISYYPRIIFTTAYDEYALKAFEENSIDYLLKPIEKGRLAKSIGKLDLLKIETANTQIQQLLQKLNTEYLSSIMVSIGDRMIPVKVENIVYFHAEDKYIFIHDKLGEKYLISASLVELEGKLDDSFIRIHRAYIINRNYVLEIQKSFNGKLNFLMGAIDKRIMSSSSYTPFIRKRFKL